MDEEVHALLLEPFSQIADQARKATEVAKECEQNDMLRSAKALLKEGERAVKKLEPQAQRYWTKYGENFVIALKKHDEICGHIRSLDKLLYDFDDYIDPEDFEAEKFDELKTCAKEAVLDIDAMLKRMKLDVPISPISRVDSIGAPSVISIVSNPSPRADLLRLYGDIAGPPPLLQRLSPTMSQSDIALTPPPPPLSEPEPDSELPVMSTQSGPDPGWNYGGKVGSCFPQPLSTSLVTPPSPEPETPPPEPNTDPWKIGMRPIGTILESDENGEDGSVLAKGVSLSLDLGPENVERRRRVSTRPDSPTLPHPSVDGDGGSEPNRTQIQTETETQIAPDVQPPSSSHSTLRRLDESVEYGQLQDEEEQRRQMERTLLLPHTANTESRQSNGSVRPSTPPPVMSATWLSTQQPPSESPQQQQQQQQWQQWQQRNRSSSNPPSGQSDLVRQSHNSNLTTSTESSNTSANESIFTPSTSARGSGQIHHVSDNTEPGGPLSPDSYRPIASPTSPDSEKPEVFATFGSTSGPSATQNQQGQKESTTEAQRQLSFSSVQPGGEQEGLEAIQPSMGTFDEGLIVVDETNDDFKVDEASIVRRTPNCSIGPQSSFHLLRGFCEGAREIMNGGAGVRQVRAVSYSGNGSYSAKCKHCFYELQWSEVEKDRHNMPDANYRMSGIGFRLRFLCKSHLPARHLEDRQYACLFCLQLGHTIEESDATVFFSQGQLFAHLARHPRPLPHVPGITVVDAPERPPELRNDFDLHFTIPTLKSELDGIRREIQQLPTGTAVDTFRKSHGTLRRPLDNVMPLQYPAGSKLVGIEFPAKYMGEWGIGWFDNMRAPFPAGSVRLEPPAAGEIRAHGTSQMTACARWKWGGNSMYKGSEWLKMDKGETISNITWAHPDHWCWAGTNSRGKWGYFPQSHIEPNSLRAAPAADRASVISHGRGSGLGRLFRSRNQSSNTYALARPTSVASASTSSS